jgi:hypothetical protein
MEENPYQAPADAGSVPYSRRWQALTRISGVVVGIATGGTVGGVIGWSLGDFGGLSDPENVGFLSLIFGAAIGLAIAIAIILRHTARRSWKVAIFLGMASAIIFAAAFILLVAWWRRP